MDHLGIISLYKYRAYNKLSIKSLENDTIWLADPASFNDPFDCKIDYRIDFTVKQYKSHLKETAKALGIPRKHVKEKIRSDVFSKRKLSKDAIHAINNLIENANKLTCQVGVFCLSEKPDDILMWSHYAESHKGYCVEYTRSPDNYLGATWTDTDEYHVEVERTGYYTKPVRYSREYPKVSILDLMAIKDWNAIHSIILTKSADWEYEKEWRLTAYLGGREIPSPAPIKSIIFGMNTPKDHRDKIRSILKNKNEIIYREARKIPGKFAISIHDIV